MYPERQLVFEVTLTFDTAGFVHRLSVPQPQLSPFIRSKCEDPAAIYKCEKNNKTFYSCQVIKSSLPGNSDSGNTQSNDNEHKLDI